MAKKSKTKIAAPTKVKVHFHPENTPGFEMDFNIPPSDMTIDGKVCQTQHRESGIRFSFFKGTIQEGASLVAAPLILPNYFRDNDSTSVKGFRKLFLLRTSATEGVSQKEIDVKRKAFFDDEMMGTGPHGCPIRILRNLGQSEKGVDKTGKTIRCSKDYYKFNGMRFYPFLLREYTVAFYVCDESA